VSENGKSNFLSTLGAVMAVGLPICGVSWFLATSVFVQKDNYQEKQEQQAVTNTRVEESVKSLNAKIESLDGTIKALNTVLQQINITGRPRRP